jgi:hypothetical protein
LSGELFAGFKQELLDPEFLVELEPSGDLVSESAREHFQKSG